MATDLVYVPIFRSRQQENLVLKSFDFGNHIFPLIEIVKEHDRKRDEEKQDGFGIIYSNLIDDINATKVFVDMPLYINERASMKTEVLEFSRRIIFNIERRTEYLLHLDRLNDKIIPVISSYLNKTGEINSINYQVQALRKSYKSLCFRVLYNFFEDDWPEIIENATADDYIILDLDVIAPYPTPAIKKIINTWQRFKTCPKIVVRSAINNDIQNVKLSHTDIVFEADNSLLDQYKITFKADAFGDYVGVKKDDLTSGGTISPGFIFYDAVNNQYIGFKGRIKDLQEFENTIVPAVIDSESTQEMLASGINYLVDQNWGWRTLNKINAKEETGKSQAKFKRIAIEHYLHCIKEKIDNGLITQNE